MRLFTLLAFLCITLVGCCRPQTIVVPCPPPPPVTEPPIRSAALPPGAGTVEVVQAYVLDLADWVSYARKLQSLLDGYRGAAPNPPPSSPSPAPPSSTGR